jgi:hypothetical protein
VRAFFLFVAAITFTGCAGRVPPAECAQLGEAVPNEGWAHVEEGSEVEWAHNPPASGPHYPAWLAWQRFDTARPRGNWLHNVEHGGVVLLFRPDAPPGAIDALQKAFDVLPDDPECGHPRALITPDPLLDSDVAVVAADVVLEGDRLEQDDVVDFVVACRAHAPEDLCRGGVGE